MSNKIKKEIYQEVNDSLNIVEVATRLGSTLHQQGNSFAGTCPTGHSSNSKNSFHVNNNLKRFHCWNCETYGDAIQLVQEVKGLNKVESLKWLVDEFHLKVDLGKLQNIPKQTPEQIQEEKDMFSRSMVFEKLVEIGKTKLYGEEGKDALDYLINERKYDEDILKKTEWFYLPEEIDIKKEMISQYPDMVKDISKLPLQGAHGDNFRLAFPYHNGDGIITGIVKRFVGGKGHEYTDKNGELKYARYDSSYGTKKGDLFGLDKVDTKEETILIVEGYPDALYFQASGIKNVTAVGQGLLSKKHLDGIRSKKVKNIIISFDNDGVGPANTEKAVLMILENSNTVPYVIDPLEYGNYKDPDEYFRANGLHSLETIIKEKPIHGALWVVKGLISDYEKLNPIEKKKVEEKIFEILLLIRDESIIAELHTELSSIFKGTLPAFKKLIRSKRDINKDNITKSMIDKPIIPFIDTNTNSRSYYNSIEDNLSLGVDEKIIEAIMLDHNLGRPTRYPTFRVEFNPHDREDRFNIWKKSFNVFSPTSYMFQKKDNEKIDLEVTCPRTFQLIKNLIPVDSERQHFINWLSYIFSNLNKARTSWVFTGTQGSGKNLFFDHIIKPLFGQKQTMVVDDARLQSDFNGFMMNKLFIAFNEVANDDTSTKRSVKSKIKSLITDEKIIINEKHVKNFEIDNFTNIMFFSNEAIPILIETDDRRFNVVETGGKLKNVKSFAADAEGFIASLNEELVDFAQYLLNYNYDVRLVDEVIENEAKASIQELSMNRFELFASKLKTDDWNWFDENFPRKGNNFLGKDERNVLMTETQLSSRKVLREVLLKSYYHTNDGWVTPTKLTRQLKLYGIKIKRYKYSDGRDDEYYYEW
jgi:DNA primase catalytic core